MSKSPRYFEYASNEYHMINSREKGLVSRYGVYAGYDEWVDVCDSCEINIPQYSCNKCGNSICEAEDCSMQFPHYSNTTYFVCKYCVDTISLKLVLQIDLGKLELLKEKIRTGTTCNSVCSSRTTSRSSNSIKTISTLSDISNTDSDEFPVETNTKSSSSDDFMELAKQMVFV